ncbi:MAG: hypothetical protein KGN39_01865 [Betaproteobacteria bacterium]|nr:hypothetical protein [Betaproteobacteria bacterium]
MKNSRRAEAPNGRNTQLRQLIASAAARIMAEDGVDDYTFAKRKAARQLGVPDTDALPANAEVAAELRAYQALYQREEQSLRIEELRQKALQLMGILQPFKPYLTGSVLDGTAGRYAEIDLLLFPDSAKEVEIFLLNRNLEYHHETPRHDRVEAVLQVEWDGEAANLVIYPPQDERSALRNRDGRVRERARLDAVAALLRQE